MVIVKAARSIEVVIDCLKRTMSMRAGLRGLFLPAVCRICFLSSAKYVFWGPFTRSQECDEHKVLIIIATDFSRFQCVYVLINTQNISSKVKIPRHFLSISGELVETRHCTQRRCRKSCVFNGTTSRTMSSTHLEICGRTMTLQMWPWPVKMVSKLMHTKWFLWLLVQSLGTCWGRANILHLIQ